MLIVAKAPHPCEVKGSSDGALAFLLDLAPPTRLDSVSLWGPRGQQGLRKATGARLSLGTRWPGQAPPRASRAECDQRRSLPRPRQPAGAGHAPLPSCVSGRFPTQRAARARSSPDPLGVRPLSTVPCEPGICFPPPAPSFQRKQFLSS